MLGIVKGLYLVELFLKKIFTANPEKASIVKAFEGLLAKGANITL